MRAPAVVTAAKKTMLRQFRSDPLPMVGANGRPNPAFMHRGPCRPLTERENVITDLVAEAMDRGLQNFESHFLEEALLEFDTAIAIMPDFPHAHWNRGQVLLMLGRLDEGFAEFDWRFKLFGDTLWHQGLPIWCGEDLRGRRLLLWHEHGFGDTIMVARYVRVLQEMGAQLTLAVPIELRPLMRQQFDVEVLDDVPKDFGRFDYRCPLFNLVPVMQQLRIPIPPAPYLDVVDPITQHTVIGIAWSGNRENSRDKHRSIDLEEFVSRLDANGYDLQAIQMHELDDVERYGIARPEYGDFAETANALMRMRHIVTVDTAVAHLAGAIGHPSLHVLVPHVAYWPWYATSTWYRTAKVYRQPKVGDWASAFDRVNDSLWRTA